MAKTHSSIETGEWTQWPKRSLSTPAQCQTRKRMDPLQAPLMRSVPLFLLHNQSQRGNCWTRDSGFFKLVPASRPKRNLNCLKRSEIDNSYSVHVYKALQFLKCPQIHKLPVLDERTGPEIYPQSNQSPVMGWGHTPALSSGSFQMLSHYLELRAPCECRQLLCAPGDSGDQPSSRADWQRKPFPHIVSWCRWKGVSSTMALEERNTSNVPMKPAASP